MPELLTTLDAIRKRDYEERKFFASLKGINLDEEKTGGTSFEDVELRASGINASKDDVVSLQGRFAQQAGFGIGEGLGYTKE